jgi:plasmid stabilization system protein ParE
MKVDFRRSAQKQLCDGRLWYEKATHWLGAEFSRSIEACIDKIVQNPESFPVVHQQVRKANAKRFSYTVFHVVEQATLPPRILVLSCFHTRQNYTPKE